MDARPSHPRFVRFKAARPVVRPPDGEGWIHEAAAPGLRVQARVGADRFVAWRAEDGRDLTRLVPELSLPLAALTPVLLEGRLSAPHGRGLEALESELAARAQGVFGDPLALEASDLLFWAGEDLRGLALAERRAWLERLLSPGGEPLSPYVRIAPVLDAGAREGWLDAAWAAGAAGVVSKRLAGGYRPGRLTSDWTYTERPRRRRRGLARGLAPAFG